MIFPVLEMELLVQEIDKTRLDASKSYAVGTDTITSIEIKPYAAASYIDVTALGYLDWQYTKTVPADATEVFTATVRINGALGTTKDQTITVIKESSDLLFSTDAQLRSHEPNIMRFLKDGRATYKDIHRRAQTLILDWLSSQGYTNDLGNRITKDNITLVEELAQWSSAVVLRLIHEGVANAKDDVFMMKAHTYKGLENLYRDKAIVRLDLNADGVTDSNEGLDIRSCVVIRR